MDIVQVRAMVDQFIGVAGEKRDAVVEHVVATGVPVIHACWELFGRAKGQSCFCTPCREAPLTGEVVLRILVQGGPR